MEDFAVEHMKRTLTRVRVEPYKDGHRLVSAIDCRAGATLLSLELEGRLVRTPTRTSIQVELDQHVEAGDTLAYMNHSFLPTVRVGRDNQNLIVTALVDLKDGTPVVFDYNTTEYVVSNPFIDYRTGRWVKGYKHLDMDSRFEINGMIMPYLREVV